MNLLFLDLETSPNTAYVWGLYKENIPLARLIETSKVLCWSAKWYGEEVIEGSDIKAEPPEFMLAHIHNLLNEADAVVHYNGSSFDIPVLNKEFLLYGFTPPSPYKQIDLLQTVRKQFKFTSNKLDHVCQELGLGKKDDTTFTLWVDCMKGDPAAWDLMRKYNKQDVVLLERLYNKLLPWIRSSTNYGLYKEEDNLVCPNCGSKHYHKRGVYYTATRKYQRYQCQSCYNWFRDTKAIPISLERFQNAI